MCIYIVHIDAYTQASITHVNTHLSLCLYVHIYNPTFTIIWWGWVMSIVPESQLFGGRSPRQLCLLTRQRHKYFGSGCKYNKTIRF